MGSTGAARPTGGGSGFVRPSREFSSALYSKKTTELLPFFKNVGVDSQVQFKQFGEIRTYIKVSDTKWDRQDGKSTVNNRELANLIIRLSKSYGTIATFYDDRELKVRFI